MDRTIIFRIGFWAAIAVTVSVSSFALFLILGLFGIDTLLYSFIACFILAPSFVALMVANHHYSLEERKIWSHLGLVFAIIYAVFITLVYFLQITIVLNEKLSYSEEIMKLLVFTPGSALFSIDMLGYAFMSLSTLFVAFIFENRGVEKWLKRLLIINGLFFIPSLVYPAITGYDELATVDNPNVIAVIGYLFWNLLFSSISILSAIHYRRLLKESSK